MITGLLGGCDRGETPAQPKTLAAINSRQILKVGYIVFPPCIVKDSKTNQLSGHFVKTIEEIALQAGWKVEWEEADWSTFVAGLAAKRYDLSIAPTFVTVPRAVSVAFTKPLFYAGNSAVVRKGETRFSDLASLDQPGVKIAVTQGEAGQEYAKSSVKRAEVVVHTGGDQALTFQDVLSGRADVGLGDAYVSAKFAGEHAGEIDDLFAGRPYNLTPVSWAVRYEDDDLLTFLNASIDALETQGKLLQYELEANAHWPHPKREWTTR